MSAMLDYNDSDIGNVTNQKHPEYSGFNLPELFFKCIPIHRNTSHAIFATTMLCVINFLFNVSAESPALMSPLSLPHFIKFHYTMNFIAGTQRKLMSPLSLPHFIKFHYTMNFIAGTQRKLSVRHS